VLVGRAEICLRLERLLDSARQGQSAALAIIGEPGSGKTTLLQYAADESTDMSVLRARGFESEADIPYAGLSELLRPLLGQLDDLPEPQAAALAAALAIGPPTGADRFAVGAATLGLLAAAAERAPLLVLVDDVQWLDRASAEALSFAQRRLGADSVLVLLTWRLDTDVPEPLAALPMIELPGLDETAARALLDARGYHVEESLLPWLIRTTGGNPLALVELPQLLSPADLACQALRAEPIPVGRVLETAYWRRIAVLPVCARRALLVAALLDGAGVAVVAHALHVAGTGLPDLALAEDMAMVRFNDGVVAFRHPLVRSAVYHGSVPSERRAAHLAVATALDGPGRPYDELTRAWHMASATSGVDESVAQLLENRGEDALTRGGYHAGLLAYERAAQLSEDPRRRVGRLLAAASSALTAGLPERTSQLLKQAEEESGGSSDEFTALIQLRGRLETWHGAPLAAVERLEREALRLRPIDAGLATQLAGDAVIAAAYLGQMRRASQIADLFAEMSTKLTGSATIMQHLLVGSTRALRGDGARALPELDQARTALDVPDPPIESLPQLIYLAGAYSFIDGFGSASALLNRAVTLARRRGAVGLLPLALTIEAVMGFRTGDWQAAYANAFEAVQLAEDTNRTTDLPNALAALAIVEAGQGKQESRLHAHAAVSAATQMGTLGMRAQAYSALGLLELGAGRTEAAVGHLQCCRQLALDLGFLELGHLQWAAELVESLVRQGTPAEAVEITQQLKDLADQGGSPLIAAWAARCQGLVARDAAFEPGSTE